MPNLQEIINQLRAELDRAELDLAVYGREADEAAIAYDHAKEHERVAKAKVREARERLDAAVALQQGK